MAHSWTVNFAAFANSQTRKNLLISVLKWLETSIKKKQKKKKKKKNSDIVNLI